MRKKYEALRHLRQGAVSGDWLLLDIAPCRKLIKQAETKREANYYISMLLMIRQRESGGLLRGWRDEPFQ
jgi:hypothetical protein